MSTINNRKMVDLIIANKGLASDPEEGEEREPRIIKIVQYNNKFNGQLSYGLIFEGEDRFKYAASPYVIHPVTIWTLEPEPGSEGEK